MPQLIAMVIVVVAAMIYMFQTFGGTGDKIEGIAQKTSIITEINNIKNGLHLALRADDISRTAAGTGTSLADLATIGYFANQMNDEISNNVAGAINLDAGYANLGVNAYSAISFGGETNPSLILTLVTDETAPTLDADGNPTNITQRPGIRVQLLNELFDNRAFLENQIATDLAAVASIDRVTVAIDSPVVLSLEGDVDVSLRAVAQGGTVAADTATLADGIFTIYFKDLPTRVIH